MSRTHVVVALVTFAFSLGQAGAEEPPILADAGRSDYRIVIAEAAAPAVRHAAEELQGYLKKSTGAELPIVSDQTEPTDHEIVLGRNRRLELLGVKIDFDALGAEGYVLRTVGTRLIIAGGNVRGALYGVYGLLEDHLGCRWFAPGVERIPAQARLALPALDETKIPVLEYREPFTRDCFDPDWCARNRVNGDSGHMDEAHGGTVRFVSGMFVHTFNSLVPPDKYFDEHPEYFSEINGQRVKDWAQLCCTNEDVIRLCTEGVLNALRKDPGAFVVSLSQNDCFNYCQCPRCRELSEAEGSPMAPLLQMVNRAAEAVAKEFPGKCVETLAYQWSRPAPKTIRPGPNVIIRLCSIECCFAHPLATCDSPQNAAFRRDIEAWSKICERLWIWDYCTSFTHYLVPFPNQRVRDDNIRFFVKNHVKGIFEQDCYDTPHSELAELGGYLNAKFLWNPEYDERRAMDEFLEGYYGPAAGPIRRYIDLLHDYVEKNNIHDNIWIGPGDAHLTDELLAEADGLWEQAEAAVAGQSDLLRRVQLSRLSADYAICERARASGAAAYEIDHVRMEMILRPNVRRALDRFLANLESSGVTRLHEGRDLNFAAYKTELTAALRDQRLEPLPAVDVDESKLLPGLEREFFQGHWDRLPDFAALPPGEKSTSAVLELGTPPGAADFALRFRGYLHVVRDGIYTFHVTSDDGSRLELDGKPIVDNDGPHAARERQGVAALRAGWHALTLTYFQGAGDSALQVRYAGPETAKQALPPEALRRLPDRP